MSDTITPDEAIEACLKEGAQGISLGLAKRLQEDRNEWKSRAESLSKELAELREKYEDESADNGINARERLAAEKRVAELEAERAEFVETLRRVRIVLVSQLPEKSEARLGDWNKEIVLGWIDKVLPAAKDRPSQEDK